MQFLFEFDASHLSQLRSRPESQLAGVEQTAGNFHACLFSGHAHLLEVFV